MRRQCIIIRPLACAQMHAEVCADALLFPVPQQKSETEDFSQRCIATSSGLNQWKIAACLEP